MNINMSDFFKNNISSGSQTTDVNVLENVSHESSGSNNAVQAAGMKILNSLMSGDTFTGYVSQLNGDNAYITMNNGAQIQAKLMQGALINIGQNVTFMVEDNSDNKISIKPVLANEQQAVLIDKALEAAGLGATDDNINIVKELLGLGMPVDAQTLGNMVKYSMKFPEASLNTVANLMRLEIPVNEQNIREFQMYGQFNGHIENLLSDMENGIVNDLLKNNQDIMDFKNVITGMYEGLDGETVNSSSACDVLSQQTIDELNNMLSDSGVKLNNDISETSVKELINQLAENNSLNSDNFQKIINSGSFREILHAVINDTMKLTPKDIQEGEEAVSSYYKRIRKNVENIENSLKSAGNSAPELSKSLSDIKSNIDFMNDLNKNMTYFQMPVKFSESEGNGELYVFTNKKNLANKTDNISAMLHLDMDNLKSMDIYVNLSGGNNVSTNFVLETEELLDFVYQHIDRLNARLEKLGYNTHFEMKVAADSSDRLDFVKDFIEAEARPAAGGQYIFDAKA